MDHQDWKPVVFSKKPKVPVGTTVTKVAKSSLNSNSVMPGTGKKITDEDEIQKIPTVGNDIGKQIQVARCAKKLSQKQLAQMMNIQPQVVQQHENGKAIRNNSMLAKFERALGTKFNR